MLRTLTSLIIGLMLAATPAVAQTTTDPAAPAVPAVPAVGGGIGDTIGG